ncbi:MAG: hypothetical protein J0L70_14350 [Leptolyngbya sp. UWPOB_LEPTO1]|uniref:hypothetical protein n=1 Tax=Leptolyngbya sp. UWPOB_LEPTO1 TaxID=2815653 RepID=UPI001AD034BD|nr:hypothetical protein [Leptolyngbya sp. UWPOB_LEPTO1]MBN8561708.1 hypothetical protein [Leptolyngbya sp. UWPOB_LEPTO1]
MLSQTLSPPHVAKIEQTESAHHTNRPKRSHSSQTDLEGMRSLKYTSAAIVG